MLELAYLLWVLTAFFAYMGSMRGWTKEVISLAGIVLGLFALFQFDTLIRQTLFGDLGLDMKFYLQTAIFLTIVYFAYQTRAVVGREAVQTRSESSGRGRAAEGRDPLQARILGAMVGGVNGYLVSGTIWYFLDINRTPLGDYPLTPFVIVPPAGTLSGEMIRNLPLYVLTQNGANSDLLALSVVILFIVVLIMI